MNKYILLSSICITAAIACQPVAENSANEIASTVPADTKIFAFLKKTDNQFKLYASTQLEADSAKFCISKSADEDCAEDKEMKIELSSSIHNIFSTSVSIESESHIIVKVFSNNDLLADQKLYFKDLEKGDANIDIDVPQGGEVYDWRKEIVFKQTGTYTYRGNTYKSKTFKDVMTHVKSPYLRSSPMTIVHESLHFLLHENGRSGAKFIYYKEGQGALFPEPTSVVTKDMNAVLPSEIKSRGKIYNTYVKSRPNQTIGENIVDEWNAYIVEALALIETVEARSNMQNDGVEGASMEAAYYNAAAIHAIYKANPDFFKKENSKAVFAMLFEQTKIIRDKQVELNMRKDHTEFMANHLATSEDAAEIRSSLKAVFGEAWTNAILGF